MALSSTASRRRRRSLFPGLAAIGLVQPPSGSPIDPTTNIPTIHGQEQTTTTGRRLSQNIVPAWSRRLSVGESSNPCPRGAIPQNALESSAHDAFYDVRLTIDESSEEDDPEPYEVYDSVGLAQISQGKSRSSSSPVVSPAVEILASASNHQRRSAQGQERRRRPRKGMKKFDDDLNSFNRFAQNGLASTDIVSPSFFDSSVLQTQPGFIDQRGSESVAVPVGDGFDALDVMGDHIFRIGAQRKKWFRAPKMGSKHDSIATGVTIRAQTGLYRTFPVGHEALAPFEAAMSRLNPEVGIKLRSDIVSCIMATYIVPFPSMSELVIDENTRIQILDSIELLARARKHQYAAFIRSERALCVWADDVDMIVAAAETLEESLVHFVWRGEAENAKHNQDLLLDVEKRKGSPPQWDGVREPEKPELVGPTISALEDITLAYHNETGDEDPSVHRMKDYWRERPVMLIAPLSDALSLILVMTLIGLGLRTLVKEYALDGKTTRFSLIIFTPPLFCIASYACMCVIGSIFQILGPIRQVTQKSRYFSGIAPKRTMGDLPHVTVQLPVYKESLEEVIMPTIESLKKAITTYERQGGSVGVLVCDDGLQLLSQAEADRRRRFYFNNSIAFVARPGHGVDGFVRKGRFKKAGNMNFAAALSLRVEEIMDDIRPVNSVDHPWNDIDENKIYEHALEMALAEKEGKAWAEGNIRFGEIILIIDSDTRVPEDCFADAVTEMKESPEVAIIQHMSGVMQVANHFFENGVAHFTRGIQHAISYCCASGEVAPFVGHNAFLRWSALQECMSTDPDDGVSKIWSEDHVSEDFQIAVTLQMRGYTVRWATYSGGEFEEGVSLTCDDELNRWQKYAFGCSELLFHPIRHWLYKGPITPLFKQFVWSNIAVHSKFTICGYIFSYYAIACAWFLSVANYFIAGFDLPVDGYYLPSWEVNLVCIILFVGLCNVAFIVLRYRLKIPDCSKLAFDQIKWVPFFSIFFTGMSMPMSAALFSHLVGYNMTWSTTIKTVEKSNFFLQLPIIWRRFWPQLVFFAACAAMMIITSSSLMPSGFRVHNIEVYVPMGILTASHLLYPFALNPWFLSFSF